MECIEKVIKSINGCINDGLYCNKCDYDGCVFKHGSCEKDLLADALELLKMQKKLIEEAREEGFRAGQLNVIEAQNE